MGALSSMMGGKSEDQWREERAKKEQYARELGLITFLLISESDAKRRSSTSKR
jgi:hypothetical protein